MRITTLTAKYNFLKTARYDYEQLQIYYSRSHYVIQVSNGNRRKSWRKFCAQFFSFFFLNTDQ